MIRRLNLIGAAICIGAAMTVCLRAQDLPFRTYSIENGLAQSVVYSILQAQDGYLWFGTQTGLSRFDGLRFKTFDRRHGMKSDLIRAIFEDQQGHIWVGTEDGSGYLGDDAVFHWLDGLEQCSVRSIAQTFDGRIWFGTYGRGVSVWNGERLRHIPFELEADTQIRVRALLASPDGSMLVGTFGHGLFRILGDTARVADDLDGQCARIRALCADGHRVLVGGDEGLFLFEQGRLKRDDLFDALQGTTVTSIMRSLDERLWIATRESGVCIIDGGQLSFLTTDVGLANNSVYALEEDREGSMWFGTYGAGAARLGHQDFVIYHPRHGLPVSSVYAFEEDDAGRIWSATNGGGVAVIDGHQIRHLTTEDGLVDNTVLSLARDWNGDLWIGTLNGVCIYSAGRFLPAELGSSLSPIVYDIAQAPSGEMWFATYDGLIRFIDGAFVLDTRDPAFAKRHNVIAFADDGVAWLGTSSGVIRLDGDDVFIFDTGDGLPGPFVNDIEIGSLGEVWVATTEGLARIKGTDVEVFGAGSGLPSDFCTLVVESSDGLVWVGTNRGLCFYDGDGFRVYNARDGLPSDEVNRGAGYVDSRGRFWAGTIGGIACFDHPSKRRQLPPPPVHLTSVRTLDRPLNPEHPYALAYHENYLRFRYEAVAFSQPELVQYMVMLEGLDQDWIALQGREIQYTSLAPGEYDFKVKAHYPGSASSPTQAFSFSIVPPLWQEPWFRVLALVVVSIILIAWILRLIRQKNRLEQRVHERTQEVRRMYEEIKHLAVTDDLTGIRNRRYMDLMMPMEMKRLNRRRIDAGLDKRDLGRNETWAGVLLVDLDYFKQINDSFGHVVGDEVLTQATQLLKQALRETDLMARVGGEEFLIYLPEVGAQSFGATAEKLLATLRSSEITSGQGKPIRVTCSIGYCLIPTHIDSRAVDWRDTVRIADAALYKAKRTGRDRAVGIRFNTEWPFEEIVARVDQDIDESLKLGVVSLQF